MKKIIIFLLSAWFLQSCCCCDKLTVSPDIAFLAGVGKSGIGGSNSSESYVDPVGVQVSIEAKLLELSENSSVSTGLGVSFQGAGWEENGESGDVKLTYLNVPVLYNYKSNSGFYGEIGLQPGILLSAKDKYDGESYDYKDWVKNFELGLPIGAGYMVNDQLGVGVRATFGITNLDNTESDVSDHNFLIVGMIRYIIDWPSNK